MSAAVATATKSIELTRDSWGTIIDSFGVLDKRRTVELWVEARRVDDEGFSDVEIVRLTVGLAGPVRQAIETYISVMLPGFKLNDWQTWVEPSGDEPF